MAIETSPTRAERSWVVPASAVVFAVLFILGMLLSGMSSDTQDKTVDEILKDFDDNKVAAVIAAYVLVVAALAFLPLAWAMTRKVEASLSAMALQVARWTAVLFAATLMIGGILFAALAGAVEFGGEDAPPVEFIRYIPQIGYGIILIAGALTVAVFLVIVSRAGQTGGALAQWFCILGYVAAVAMLVGVLFIPMLLLPIWAIAAAFQLKGPALA